MKKVCRELIDYFEQQEGWDKEEIIADYCAEILKENDCTMLNDVPLSPDEISLNWGDDLNLPITLQDFADRLFDKIMEGVCNVIKTA